MGTHIYQSRFFTLLVILSLLVSGALSAQNSSIFQTLGQIVNQEVTMIMDFESINKLRKKDESFPGLLKYKKANGDSVSWNVKLLVRGRYRRLFCEFPPLKVVFSKTDLEAKGLAHFNDLKWVTHCFDGPKQDENLLREYLVYGLYQQISPYSYRTQLLKVTYINANNPDQQIVRFAFILEDDGELSERLGLTECKNCFVIKQDAIDPKSENSVSVFQYLIGNTDWSISRGQKNVKYFQPSTGGKMVVIPHDFDFSGFVNAAYAVPASGTNLQNVKQRAFLGYKAEKAIWEHTMNLYDGKQKGFIQYIESFPLLSEDGKKECIQYINSFFSKDARKLLATQEN
ncbi:MAG: hypothetical protein SFV55_14420 [Haliscomenobacter sp.]|uniref:hypothetical protein n=1 Tax=Haliscomenobacter sp. TaxID=2717303 RepID=UPI0029A50CB3|nr:hypothetical protein [Haliscomenobacter sp.]MDX2069619.1 hypothetical protein [Haliscomenobacter sp.]